MPQHNRYVKPRLSMSSFRHDEVYNINGLQKAIEEYDQTLMAHWKKVGGGNGEPWSETVAVFPAHLLSQGQTSTGETRLVK